VHPNNRVVCSGINEAFLKRKMIMSVSKANSNSNGNVSATGNASAVSVVNGVRRTAQGNGKSGQIFGNLNKSAVRENRRTNGAAFRAIGRGFATLFGLGKNPAMLPKHLPQYLKALRMLPPEAQEAVAKFEATHGNHKGMK
jgi:hypothetical protein